MGFNTTVVVLNDAIHQIKDDTDFGRKLHDAVLALSVRDGSVDVSAGNHCNAASVIETHHADQMHMVVVGGNLGRDLGHSGNWKQWDDDEALLRILADRLGYTLRRKNNAP